MNQFLTMIVTKKRLEDGTKIDVSASTPKWIEADNADTAKFIALDLTPVGDFDLVEVKVWTPFCD